MLKNLLDYEITALLGESMHADVYQARLKASPKHKLVIKKIKAQFCSRDLQIYLQQQISHFADLNLPHCVIPHLKSPSHETLCLIQPWITGISLSEWLAKRAKFDLTSVLNIIIAIAEQIEQRHKAGFIHKSIKPSNIIIQPDTLEIQIIDDIRILDINQISHFIYQDSFRIHTLPYISPEQTGRIKQEVNYSTDLYSLGMIFFECLTGKVPFLFDDPITIIHSHLAEIPRSVCKENSQIPHIINKIVQNLLLKAPEKRYQTALGLVADLKIAEQQWLVNQEIKPFSLKQKDFSNRITLPSLLVGRDVDKKQLLSEHERSCAGEFRAAFISGLSGIGKTRLIQELQLPIIAHSAYFTSGKFDQFTKHIPYSTLIQAWTHLIKTFLTEDKQHINYWKKRINQALGDNAQLIIDLVPELALIIGPQPLVKELPPIESRNRFNNVAGNFLACLASKKHPLALFIDDLQWCDGASFDLLERLFTTPEEYSYTYLIGAYRHNEVDSSHRLSYLINKVKTNGSPLLEIRLEALTVRDVNQMTAYILNTYPTRTQALAELIYQTSAGNPLFVNESLRWLHSYQHLHLSDQGLWTWDEAQLRHTAIPSTALDLFKDKIQKLRPESRELLAIAACLGATFSADDLALIAALSKDNLYKTLSDAFSHNILLKDKERVYFFHDQVQAAAESFLDTHEKQKIHARIAKALIKAVPKNSDLSKLSNIFTIVEHLFSAGTELRSDKDKQQAAEFNYFAGIAAMNALAMDNANFFFKQSKLLFPCPNWLKHYDFLFKLHKHLARTEMALGNQQEAEKVLNTLIQESKTELDKADCLYEQTTGLSSMGNFVEAIKLGNRGLQFFDREIPLDDALALEKSRVIISQIHNSEADIWQKILSITPSSDRATQIETAIYSELIPDYYLAGMVPQLYLAAIQSTQNCLAGGVDESVIYGFSMVGLYLQRQGQYSMSFRYEDLGLALSERYPDTFGATKGINGILWTNMHNRRDSEHIIEQCQKNIYRGKNCGDLYNAGLSYGPYIWHLIHQGADLGKIPLITTECIHFSNKFNLSLSSGLAESAVMGWVDLMITGKASFSEQEIAEKIQQWESRKHVVSIGGYYTLAGISQHYLGDYQLSAKLLLLAEPYLRGLSDNILNRLWYVFRYVNSLRLNTLPFADEQAILDDCLDKVKSWSSLGPILRPYLAFMFMETHYCAGNFSETRRLCLDAIDLARVMKFTLLEGFLYERTAHLLFEQQHEQADCYLRQSLTAYQHCSALVKVQQLENNYGIVLENTLDVSASKGLAQQLDVDYLLQATRSITQQLDMKSLLETILQAVMERLGAKSAYLLIVQDSALQLMAKGEKQEQISVKLAEDQKLEALDLSLAIVNYVHHTGQLVVLKDAAREGDFTTDKIVKDRNLKSIFCIPLIIKQQVLGVLYLENKLISEVFTNEQIELTKLLSAQAAIALQNTLLLQQARASEAEIKQLNKSLEDRVSQRTQALNTANEELKNFAYVVSHDLKAPLRAINQLAGWISEDYASSFDAEGQEQMQLLRNRARRMHDMIEGILQYSRVGRLHEQEELIDIAQLIDDVIRFLVPQPTISISLAGQFPVITGEKLRVFQVFQNLIDNAIKYNDKEQGKIEISCLDNTTEWIFCVADNGPGIAPQYQQKIFQLFQTLNTKDQTESTGIGLSLIEKIVHNWQGKIWLESDGIQGCKFLFSIPKSITNE
ncbi:MAG: AAA family ATPase [Methylococcaceae bacterium]|nr:AAA family ATPase [Methylococcaceae bacterium]